MLITLNRKTQLKLTDLVQDNYTELDLYREKPMLFDDGKRVLIIKPVPFRVHDKFLKEMAEIIFDHYHLFKQIDFLTAFNYKSKTAMNKVMQKVELFTANKTYKKFKKDASKFVEKWTYISKKKEILKPKRNRKKVRKFLEDVEPSEFIYMVYLLFVYNFDIVKKNSIEFLKMFTGGVELEKTIQQSETSSFGTLRKAVVMPKFSEKPYSRSTLNLLEEQSKL